MQELSKITKNPVIWDLQCLRIRELILRIWVLDPHPIPFIESIERIFEPRFMRKLGIILRLVRYVTLIAALTVSLRMIFDKDHVF